MNPILLNMNMKNTAILLMLLLSILGLVIGVYYTADVSSDSTPHSSWERLHEEHDGILTVSLQKKENNESYMNSFFT